MLIAVQQQPKLVSKNLLVKSGTSSSPNFFCPHCNPRLNRFELSEQAVRYSDNARPSTCPVIPSREVCLLQFISDSTSPGFHYNSSKDYHFHPGLVFVEHLQCQNQQT